MKKRNLFFTAFLLLLSFSLYAQRTVPNFIVFIADDVSWDDLGCYGNEEVQTPNIDRLAANGLKFTNVYLTASSCSPSRNSIMCGRYPHNAGAAELHTEPPLDMVSFPEVLRQNGYYSGQGGKFHMGKYAERGFDVIYRKREEVGDGGEESWLKTIRERPKDQPFFMWFAAHDAHRAWGPNDFSGTHDPEDIEPPFYLADAAATKSDLAKYYDEIKRFDHYIGEVVKELETQNALDNTVILIMADNGRPFPHSKTRVNDRGMKTPFIVHWPAQITSGGQCNSLVSVIDIAPTLLSLAGIESPEAFQGRAFDELIDNPGQPFRNHIFAEHNWHDYEAHERMVRNQNFMYILNSRPLAPQMGPADAVGSPAFEDLNRLKALGQLSAVQADIFVTPRPMEELYDLRSDKQQLINLAGVPDRQSDLLKMRNILEEWMEVTGDNIPQNLTPDWYLREPGYIKTRYLGSRGEMPGKEHEATKNNNKGKF